MCLLQPKKRNKSNAIEKVCEEEQNRIRQKVHEFWFRREVPNLSKVTRAINEDPALGTYARTTLYRILLELKFKFTSKHRNSALIEKDYIVCWRHNYLNKLAQYT